MTGHEQTFQQTLTRFGHDRTKQLHYAETKIQRRLVLLYLQNRLHRATRHTDWRKSISLQVCKRADKAGLRCLTETGRSRRQFELLEVTGQHDHEHNAPAAWHLAKSWLCPYGQYVDPGILAPCRGSTVSHWSRTVFRLPGRRAGGRQRLRQQKQYCLRASGAQTTADTSLTRSRRPYCIDWEFSTWTFKIHKIRIFDLPYWLTYELELGI